MADYNIPRGLLAIQRRFLEAEARTAEATTPEDFQKAFKDQQQAAIDKHRHPWWETVDNRFKADMALREAVRETAAPAE